MFKNFLLRITIIICISCKTTHTNSNYVSFETVASIDSATKDGAYFNEYVVEISYEKLKKLNGKRIRVSGEVTLNEGLQKIYNKQDSLGQKRVYMQGRLNPRKHIQNPKIKILG